MTISFYPYVLDKATRQWKFPDAVGTDPDAFEFCLSNHNASDVLLALGINPADDFDPMPINAFAGLLTATLRRHLDRRSPELPTREDAQSGTITMIYVGRREGYIERRLGELATLVQRSRAAGATHIGWG